jgi:hypothetical protein
MDLSRHRGVRVLSLEVFREETDAFDWVPSTLFSKRPIKQSNYQKYEHIEDEGDPKDYFTFYNRRFDFPPHPIPFAEGCVRLVEYDENELGECEARLLTYCKFNLRCLRRKSERLKSMSRINNDMPPPVIDLTSVDKWSEEIRRSPDFADLPTLITLKFEEEVTSDVADTSTNGKIEHLTIVLIFRKVVPRRYIDCCFETGKLFCYALKATRIVRCDKK